jgi:UDPglucose 6-dehydrogenase
MCNNIEGRGSVNSVSIIGAGHVGLVTGSCLSEFGLHVVCMDSDAQKIRYLEQGKTPIYEPGLPALITKNVASGRLRFTTDIAEAVAASQVIFITVHAPLSEDGSVDIQHVFAAAESIARHMTGYKVIVNKSTVPIGTGRKVKEAVRAALDHRGLSLKFDIVSNPEFLSEGSAVRDFMRPDRIVIGGDNEKGREIIRDIYNVLDLIETPIIFTSLETAELVKYASNAFLATKIAFINEIASLCDAVHADIRDIARAMGMDGRIGKYFLHPGPGYGGSCLPKDTKALVKIGQELGAPMSIIDSVVKANELQRHRMVQKIQSGLSVLKGKVIAVLGLAFKQGTDDVRESSSIAVILELIETGSRVKIFDPLAMENAKRLPFVHIPSVESLQYNEIANGDFGIGSHKIMYCIDEYDAAKGSDAIVILTEWSQFRHLDLPRIAKSMRGMHFFDFRNLYEPDDVSPFGFIYEGVGRPKP